MAKMATYGDGHLDGHVGTVEVVFRGRSVLHAHHRSTKKFERALTWTI